MTLLNPSQLEIASGNLLPNPPLSAEIITFSINAKIVHFCHQKELQTGRMIYAALSSEHLCLVLLLHKYVQSHTISETELRFSNAFLYTYCKENCHKFLPE